MQPHDYDRLMQANLATVFSERDPERRVAAIADLYTQEAVLYEPEAAVTGRAAISDAVAALLDSLPPDFIFTAIAPAIGHHSVGRLRWQAGPPNGKATIYGMDIAHFEAGKIRSLYVYLEPRI